VGLFFGVVFFAILYGSVLLARRVSPRLLPVAETAGESNVFEWAAQRRWTGRLILLISIVIAAIVGLSYSSHWQTVLLFLHRVNFGYADPQFGKDASFFVSTASTARC